MYISSINNWHMLLYLEECNSSFTSFQLAYAGRQRERFVAHNVGLNCCIINIGFYSLGYANMIVCKENEKNIYKYGNMYICKYMCKYICTIYI